ncbi:MAG: META domain-containing protein [Rhodobiaceae bacterium]|nr:META domain-containing protein [Rhodobiaceae bacterium]MCC0049582.1 META domain-containing protein [Rhodobiaceae bacterium]
MGRRLFTALVLGCASLGSAFAMAPYAVTGAMTAHGASQLLPAAYAQQQKGPAVTSTSDSMPLGGTWQLTHLAGPGGELSGLDDALVARSQIVIGEDGKLSGTVGCNRFGTSLTLDGDDIAFTGVLATRKACFGPVWDAERGLFAAFKHAAGYTQDGNELILLDARGNAIARFARA